MCGRFNFTVDDHDEKLKAIAELMERYHAGEYKQGEIFPGDPAPAMMAKQERITALPAVFGIPGFDKGKLIINARSETVTEKPMFADSLKTRRVILPATGFYEWSHDAKKVKYLFNVDGRRVLYLCGIYKIVDGKPRFVVLTRDANESMAEIHHRMPVIAAEDEVRPYLSSYTDALDIIHGTAPELTRQPA